MFNKFFSLVLFCYGTALISMEDPLYKRRRIETDAPSTSTAPAFESITQSNVPQPTGSEAQSEPEPKKRIFAHFRDSSVLIDQSIIDRSPVLKNIISDAITFAITLPGSAKALSLLTETLDSFFQCNAMIECQNNAQVAVEAINLSNFLMFPKQDIIRQNKVLSLLLFNIIKSNKFDHKNKLQIIENTLKILHDETIINRNLIQIINGDQSDSSHSRQISFPGSQPLFVENDLLFVDNNSLLRFDVTHEKTISDFYISINPVINLITNKNYSNAYLQTRAETYRINLVTGQVAPIITGNVDNLTIGNNGDYAYSVSNKLILGENNNGVYINRDLVYFFTDQNDNFNDTIRKLIPAPSLFISDPYGLIFIKMYDRHLGAKGNLKFPRISYINLNQSKNFSSPLNFSNAPVYDLFNLENYIMDKYVSKMEVSPNGKFLVLLLKSTKIAQIDYKKFKFKKPPQELKNLSSILVFSLDRYLRLRLHLETAQHFEEDANAAWQASLNSNIPEMIITQDNKCYFFGGNTIFCLNLSNLNLQTIHSFNKNCQIKEMVVNKEYNYLAVRLVCGARSMVTIIDLYTNTILNVFPTGPYTATDPYERSLALDKDPSLIAFSNLNAAFGNVPALQIRMVINPPTLFETLLIYLILTENKYPNTDEKYRLKLYLPQYAQIKNIIESGMLSPSTQKLLQYYSVLNPPTP